MLFNPNNDGIDHINIYSKGRTALGVMLSNFYHCPIDLPEGKFESIEGYWYWLGCVHQDKDKLKKSWGYQAKKLGRELCANDWNDDSLFKLKVVSAMLAKLIQCPWLLEQFTNNTLPYAHYYVYGNKVVEPIEGKWVVETWEFLSKLLRK